MGYYIFDYAPQNELKVRHHIAYLKTKINKLSSGVKIVEYDLYQLVINVLKERGYLEKCFSLKKQKAWTIPIRPLSKCSD